MKKGPLQGELFAPPPPGDRGGITYQRPLDYARLNRQAYDVWMVMCDMRWHTLADLASLTGHPEASISARLRDFRKWQFGQHTVERARSEGGLFRYRLIPNPSKASSGA